GQQTLTVSLPTPMPSGTLLNLLAQGSGAQQKLVLVHPQALPQGAVPTFPANPVLTASVLPRPSSAPQLPPTPLQISPDKLQPLALQSGQRVEARVLGPAPNGATQVQIGRQTIEVVLPTPVSAGAILPLRVQGHGPQQSLVPLPQPQPQAQVGQLAQLPTGSAAVQQPPGAAVAPSQAQAINVPVSQTATAPPIPAAQPSPPQAALTQMVQAAVQQQDSIANLTTMLSAMVGKTPLPQPVLQAAAQVLAASLPLGPALDGAALQKAVVGSGVFQEAALAQGAPELAKGDLKTTLLTLRNTLVSWLGQPTANSSVPPGPLPLPPPVRGALPRSRPTGAAPIEVPASPAEAGKVLLERTEGSLARLRLHQHASLPEPSPAGAKPADWSMDLPVVIGNYQTVMQLQIHRDEAGSSQAASERGWQIRFAMDLPSLGEVGAQVGLRGGTTSVRLWANDAATARQFEQAAPELASALTAAGLRPGLIIVRADEPPPQPPSTGHFVDSLT
ncbi:MAG: flagellar hook-length control protein FliK, partial [Devosia sp.]